MPKRFIIAGCLILSVALLTPQIAQPVNQDETIKEAVKPAIEAGVDFLKKTHLANGVWEYQGQNNPGAEQVIGSAALCGIALMECNVPTDNKHVKDTASVVRAAANNPAFTYNYGCCLCLLFLDRLHRGQNTNHGDSSAIKNLALKIARGQCQDGGWTYNLPGGPNSDNSNTQFAVVALWVSRKYKPGPAIDNALKYADAKLRKSQRTDGGWGYDAANIQVAMEATGAMTCAGILGLALQAGTKAPSESSFRGAGASGGGTDVLGSLAMDPQVSRGRTYLVKAFDEYINNRSKHGHITYFFWSLERVATLYHWRKLDEAKTVDWFELGARYLMRIQSRNGSWNVDFLHGPAVDTSFALLFLAKSNLLGNLQETTFTGNDSIAGGNVIKPREKKTEAPKNNEQLAKELGAKLITALPNERENILNELRDAKGGEYTDALVDAIGKLDTNAAKEMARDALASRLQRMKTNVLSQFMSDDSRELRMAAAMAVRLKNDLEAASALIPLLADQDIGVSTTALESLKAISNQDFGKSVERWNRWLESNKTKKP